MEEQKTADSGRGQVELLRYWPQGFVWFREFLPTTLPWGSESLLDPVPENAVGAYGARIGAETKIDGVRYDAGQVVVVDSESDFQRLLPGLETATDLIFPWYERMVPASLVMPHRQTYQLEDYRRGIKTKLVRTLALTAGLVALAFAVPDLMFIAMIAAMIYGLHPLVELSMAWLKRVDRLTVEDLNRRLVNFEFFRRWILTRSSFWLKIGLGVLVAVFAGQLFAGTMPSIEAAALVKESVLGQGQWWRVVTTGLMHGSVIHILFNGMALYTLGRVLVSLVSPAFLSFVFLLTVVTGSLASLWLGPGIPSVGASGGILGCLGFLLVVTQKFKNELPGYLRSSLIQSTLVVAIFGALGNQFIDNAAHAGGLFGGILLGILCYPWMRLAPTSTRPVFRLLSGLSIVILLGGVVKIAMELGKLVTL